MSIRKKVLACGFLLLVFLAGFSVWYSPVLFKGYAPYKMTEIMPIAKNLSQTGKFSMEDRQSIFLPTSLINEKGEIATSGNKLSARLTPRCSKFLAFWVRINWLCFRRPSIRCRLPFLRLLSYLCLVLAWLDCFPPFTYSSRIIGSRCIL